MRMWLVDPSKMCRKHLMGEHVEMHMFVGTINAGKNISGYVSRGLVDTSLIKQRHQELAQEMQRRGYNHQSTLSDFQMTPHVGKVDAQNSEKELAKRCKDCRFYT